MRRFPVVAAAWAAVLVAGFVIVLVLGGPVASADEQLVAAMHPATPVTQAAAETSAETIMRLRYPSFDGTRRSVTRETDFGVEHWVVAYSDTTGTAPRGLRVSVVIATGRVEVSTFP
jgi:uncharacterized iron-regulated membrane protein